MDERGLGKRLQAARQAAGLTQQQLCHKANLSFSTLTKIERGAIKAPSIFTIQAIAEALGQGLDELIGGSGSRSGRTLNKTKSGVSFIYFDVNGCLVHFYQRAFVKLAQDTGAQPDVIESAYWHYNDEVCRGQMSMKDFNEKMAERLGVKEVNWQDYYLETVEPIEEMAEVVRWASEHYKIGLLTNIMPGQLSALKRANKIPNLVYDSVVDSSEVGIIKPEAGIYEVAMERAGVPAEEILLIDDSRVNLMAAGKLDWHVMWFDDSHSGDMSKQVLEALTVAEP